MTQDDFSNIYAVVKNNEVVNVIVFEGEQPMFVEALKANHDIDELVSGKGQDIYPAIGQIYDPKTGKLSYPPIPVVENPVEVVASVPEEDTSITTE